MKYEVRITPRAEREETIRQRVSSSEEDGEPIFDFRSDRFIPKVISLSIDIPVYRLENCRTFSAQQSEIAKQNYDKEFFEKGQELATAQQAQHQILLKLAKQGTKSVTPIYDELEKVGQRGEILITSTGVVVNGNRRLSAMRELYRNDDGSVNTSFSHVKCAVLPPDTTRDEIDDIEADLQARPQTKLEYDWIGDARLIRRQVNKGRTTREVADRLRRRKTDVENILLALEEADLYLSKWLNKPGQYELVSEDGQQIFSDIPKNIKDKDVGLQDASRVIAWSLFENRDRITGRLYNLNPAFGNLAPKVLDMLSEQFEIEQDDLEADEDIDDIYIDIESESETMNYEPILEILRNEDTKDDSINVLIETCETAIEIEKGKKSERAALLELSRINSRLTGIDGNTAGIKTLAAILKQIETIRSVLDKIEETIKNRQSNSDNSEDN